MTSAQRAKKVLIVRLGAFGDIIHTLPLAADLRAAGHRIGWLCEDRWASVIDGSPAIDHIHTLPRSVLSDSKVPWRLRLASLRRVVRSLRHGEYDVVIDAQGLAKSALFALACAAPVRIGHRCPRARELSWLFTRTKSPVGATHVIDQQRALALPLSRPGPRGGWRFPLPPWTAERRWARQWLERNSLVRPWLLNVGAGWPTKVWPRRRQGELVRALKFAHQSVVLAWGSHAEYDLAEEIIADAGHGLLAPPTTIPQLAGLIAGCEVLISGDTGPLHLCFAVGVPAVGLFGPVPAERNGPRGQGYRTLQAPGEAWERHEVSKVDMTVISAEQVIIEAKAAISELAGEGARHGLAATT